MHASSPTTHASCCLCSGLHPTWTNTTGVQCVIPYTFEEQDHLRFHFVRTNTSSTYAIPGLPGVVVNGSVWSLSATLTSQRTQQPNTSQHQQQQQPNTPQHQHQQQQQPTKQLLVHPDNTKDQPQQNPPQPPKPSTRVFDIGTVFLEQTFGGVTRLGAFHEHIGCTPCDAFYESEQRSSLQVDREGGRSCVVIE